MRDVVSLGPVCGGGPHTPAHPHVGPIPIKWAQLQVIVSRLPETKTVLCVFLLLFLLVFFGHILKCVVVFVRACRSILRLLKLRSGMFLLRFPIL